MLGEWSTRRPTHHAVVRAGVESSTCHRVEVCSPFALNRSCLCRQIPLLCFSPLQGHVVTRQPNAVSMCCRHGRCATQSGREPEAWQIRHGKTPCRIVPNGLHLIDATIWCQASEPLPDAVLLIRALQLQRESRLSCHNMSYPITALK